MQAKTFEWWEQKGDDIARAVFDTVRQIHTNDTGRIYNNLRYLKLYTGIENIHLETQNQVRRIMYIRQQLEVITRMQLNVVQSCSDTLLAKICKQKQRVRFLTNGGSWTMQRRAMKADKFVFGMFHHLDVHNVNKKVTLDSYIWGSGFGFVSSRVRDRKVKLTLERVMPDEVVVDPEDAHNGSPRSLYRVRPVHLSVLKSAFKDKSGDIDAAVWRMQADRQSYTTFDSVTQKILVAEAWHLPDDDGDGGMHALCIDGVTLRSEPYERQRFPVAKQDYKWNPLGYFGMGIAQMLEGLQIEIDRLVEFRKKCLRLQANPKWLVPREGKVDPEQLTNEVGAQIDFSSTTPPQQVVYPAYAPEAEAALQDLYRKAYEEVGISQLSAASKKPEGLDSGKALREFSDIETERFQMAGQSRQDWHVDLSELLLEELAECKKKYGGRVQFEVLALDKESGLEPMTYEDFALEDKQYVIQPYPVSMFPKTPEGQLAFAEDLAKGGLMEPEEALDLFDFPDTEKKVRRKLSATRWAEKVVEAMLDDGKYRTPEPYENFDRNIVIAREYYSQAKLMEIDEEKLALLRKYIDDNYRLKMKAEMPPAPVAPAQALLNSQLAATPEAQAAPAAALPPIA